MQYLYTMQDELARLRASLQQLIAVPDALWADIETRFARREIKKRETFIAEGKTCRELAFVTGGSFRYYRMVDGIETTTYFSFENDWISDYSSFLTKTPAGATVEAMEDAVIWSVSYADMQYLYDHHPLWERFGRLMAEYLVTCLDKRMNSLLLSTPEERYLAVLHDNAIYFERVPQHYIASYLGVAPESLSRIRRRVMQRAIS